MSYIYKNLKRDLTDRILMAKKSFLDRLESKQFIRNLIAFMLIVLFSIVFIIYCVAAFETPEKIYSILMNILLLAVGLIGGRALSNDK